MPKTKLSTIIEYIVSIIGFILSMLIIWMAVCKLIEISNDINNDSNGYVVNKDANGKDSIISNRKSGPTIDLLNVYINNKKQLGVKGIIYLDPTNLDASCDSTNYKSNDETSGCMKWYIFDDSGDKYKIILDHNIVDKVKWNREELKDLSYENSILKEILDNLVTNSNWKVSPRLIGTGEFEKLITDYCEECNWSGVENLENWLHNNVFNQVTMYESIKLYDNYMWLSNGESYWTASYITKGSFVNDKVERGYFSISSDSNDNSAWCIYAISTEYKSNEFGLDCVDAGHKFGLRPVIEVPKTLFD